MNRKLAILTAAAIAAGALLPPAAPIYAETETAAVSADSKSGEEKMKEALAAVKRGVSIPESFSDFTYTSGESRGLRKYSFTWSEPGNSGKQYRAAVTGDIVTEYSSPDRSSYSNKPSFASLSQSQCVSNAISFVYKLNPSMKGTLKKRSVEMNLYSDLISVNFDRYAGDIAVERENRVSVYISKRTGEAVGLTIYGWWQNADFKSSEGILTQEQIKEIYCGEVTIKPSYRVFRDEKTGKKKANIVYQPLNSFVYDAHTGKHSAKDEDYAAAMNTDLYDKGTALDCDEDVEEAYDDYDAGSAISDTAPAEGVSFSEQELAAAADLSAMLTSAQFRELLIKDKYMGVTDKYMIQNFNISRNESAECGYAITCTARVNNKTASRGVNITADAKSGRIMSFYSYSDSRITNSLNVEKAKKLASEAAKYYYGDIIGEYRGDPENSAPLSENKQHKTTSRRMVYHRYVNNIPVSDNNIVITVDSSNRVTSVSAGYDSDVDFGDGLIVSKEKALELLCGAQDMKLEYDGFSDLESKPHTYLVYKMDRWMLNAKTGRLCDYNGEPLTRHAESADNCPYTDIGGYKYKNEIETLYSYGFRIYGGSLFRPDEKITRGELEQLMNALGGSGPIMPLGAEGSSSGKAAADADKNARVTRRELARAFTRAAGVDNCAGFTSIYRSPFKDVTDKDKDIGCIALAYALGGAQGEADGKFYPNAAVTRGYAYHCVYHYISSNSR